MSTLRPTFDCMMGLCLVYGHPCTVYDLNDGWRAVIACDDGDHLAADRQPTAEAALDAAIAWFAAHDGREDAQQ